ncbi:RING-H2 finger protein ATL34-like [Sesamum indicum]|uniref:RING-type E3 ubiquitin transferase n=1 Tax=Sesamum indicum TaxID=4182 RepID=A0A8M8UT98_SESIN|nr:RING-H2 finger protein ATL34-like [Sesamum indicum]
MGIWTVSHTKFVSCSVLAEFVCSSSFPKSTHLERGLHGLEPLVVANFPTKKYRELCLSSKENSQCTVCLSEYHEEDTLRILPLCRHSFHATCIDVWLQQHSTCPVCRISLRELPERKWFMQPMFSSAIRSQYSMQSVNAHYCNCMANSERRSSGSHNNQETDPIQDGRCQPEGDRVNDLVSVNHDAPTKDSAFRKVESPSSR